MGSLLDINLYTIPNPSAYNATAAKGRGFFLGVGKGASLLDFGIRGIATPYCTYEAGIGMLDESASIEGASSLIPVIVPASIVVGGELLDLAVPAYLEGFQPLRVLYVSKPIGREIPGGKTLYAIEVITDCQDTIFVSVLRRGSSRDPFRPKPWARIGPYKTMVTMPTSGLEFQVMLYVKGGGKFRIFRITAWLKLTDRRGLHTFGEKQSDNTSTADEGS